MKLVPKFILILSVFYLFILSTVGYIWYSETQTLSVAKNDLIKENKIILEQLLDLKNNTYKTGVYDYTYWDEFVTFTKTKDMDWANINLAQFTKNFNYDYIFVYDLKSNLIYSYSDHPDAEKVEKLINKTKHLKNFPLFFDYYILVNSTPGKVYQAPIQPSADSNRVHKPYGYLVGIKLFDKTYVEELETFLHQKIVLSVPDNLHESDYRYSLLDSNDNTIALIEVKINDTLYQIVNDVFLKIVVSTLLVVLLSLLVTYWLMTHKILLPLQKLSIVDSLTNIYNRRYYDLLIPKLLESAKRNHKLINYVMLDIDHFKAYNDHYGHHKGDVVLSRIAKSLRRSLNRADDYVFRLGGEEFAVIFESETQANALVFAQKLKDNVEGLKIPCVNPETNVTISLGLVSKPAEDVKDMYQLYKEADMLLYEAKNRGRNTIVTNFIVDESVPA